MNTGRSDRRAPKAPPLADEVVPHQSSTDPSAGRHLDKAPTEADRALATAVSDRVPSTEGRKSRPRSGWVVLEQFVHDGFHYRVTRRPVEPQSDGPRLTKREAQALAYAYAGYSNKAIADVLGVAASTVGVLLFRAATKMGVRSRRELLKAYARWKAQSDER